MNSIIIFTNYIRPVENWLGIVEMAKRDKLISRIIIIKSDSKYNEFLKNEKIDILESPSKLKIFFLIQNSKIIFGLPSFFFFFKIISIKKLFVYIAPGNIKKAIGIYKNPRKSNLSKIFGFVKYLNRNVCYVSEDFNDSMYTATGYGRSISFYLPIGLPKKVFINKELCKNVSHKGIGILFVPTHRWEGYSSTISRWLKSEKFVNSLIKNNYSIYYNNHPEEADYEVDSRVILTRKLNEFPWKNIKIVVTDYSSIGLDFLSAGGAMVINIIDDIEIFEKNQGKSPFHRKDIFVGETCINQDEFFSIISDKEYPDPEPVDIDKLSKEWFNALFSKNNKIK